MTHHIRTTFALLALIVLPTTLHAQGFIRNAAKAGVVSAAGVKSIENAAKQRQIQQNTIMRTHPITPSAPKIASPNLTKPLSVSPSITTRHSALPKTPSVTITTPHRGVYSPTKATAHSKKESTTHRHTTSSKRK